MTGSDGADHRKWEEELMIDTVVFDIGQVLKGWHPEKVYDLLPKEAAEGVIRAIWKSGLWEQMDLGIRSDEELFSEMLLREAAYQEEIRYIFHHLSLISERYDYAISWVKELKEKGYKVLFLSNYSRHLRKNVPETIDFLPYMDGGIFSSDVNLLKPDPRIYRLLCERYHVKPEQCLFIDDRKENVDGAIAVGMKSVQFQDFETSYPIIMEYLEKIR